MDTPWSWPTTARSPESSGWSSKIELKRGELRAIVATSSLELGIDMGAVDLVIQVESPGAVSRGLQRIGRAGHSVGAPSRGSIFPKHRGDLLETAIVTRRMVDGLIESTHFLRNPLDVLAQQIVAHVAAVDECSVDEVGQLVRGCANFAQISDELLNNVLDLLSGRYPSEEFSELRPRLVWDRVNDRLRARDGSKRLGGHLRWHDPRSWPVRGVPARRHPGRRTRRGDGVRVAPRRDVHPRRVHVAHRRHHVRAGHGHAGARPAGQDAVLARRSPGPTARAGPGARVRSSARSTISTSRPPIERLMSHYSLDAFAANNLVQYIGEQVEATGAVPDDRTIVVERFRDEIGDWRVCILSPFGTPVHAPWAMAIERRLADQFDIPVESMWGDDGIVIRLPESADELPLDALLIDPEDIDELVVSTLPQTAMFAARFRECAGRALLLPRRRPDRRTPLWQQRQRAADLLAVASKYPTFPILLETSRECLQDVFDVPALREVLGQLRSRSIRVVNVDTGSASPMASSLLFNWIAAYMYEGDAPLAERRAAALALDRDLLRDLLGAEELRELLDADVLADVELELQCLADGRRARSVDELHDVLRRVGDLSMAEIDLRCEAPAHADDDAGPTSRADLDGSRASVRNGSTRCWPRSGRSRSGSAVRCGTPPARTPPGIAMRSGCSLAARAADGLHRAGRHGRWRNWSAGTPAPTGPFIVADVARRFGADHRTDHRCDRRARGGRPYRARRVPPRRRVAGVLRRRRAAAVAAAIVGIAAP